MEGSSISRDKLIQAGIHELENNGLSGFSLRRVAQSCGVSCAAPYKHFKDKNALLCAIAEEYNVQWAQRQAKCLEHCGTDIAQQIQSICMEYLHFLLDNPNFCVLATQADASINKWHLQHLLNESSPSKKLIYEYCMVHGITPETAHIKITLLRGQLLGIAMMVGVGEFQLTEESIHALFVEMNSVFLS